jgi:hypothetical protein
MNIDYFKIYIKRKKCPYFSRIIMFEKLGVHPFNKSDSWGLYEPYLRPINLINASVAGC